MRALGQKRDIGLDVLKAVGITFMILGHTGFGKSFALYIAGFHMQLFFIVSGLLLNVSKYNFKEYVLRKAKALLIPYVFFAAITMVVCTCTNIFVGEQLFDYNAFWKGIIYSNQGIFPITGAIWFLQCLFTSSVIAYVIIKYLPTYLQLLCIIALILISWCLSYYLIQLPFAIDSSLSATVFLYIGYRLKDIWKELSSKVLSRPRINLLFVLCLAVLSYVLIRYNGLVSPRRCVYGNVILYYANAIITTYFWYIICCTLVKKLNNSIFINELNYIGQHSIVYLGFNQLIIKFTLLFLPAFLTSTSSFKTIRQVLLFTISMALLRLLCCLIYRTKLRRIL